MPESPIILETVDEALTNARRTLSSDPVYAEQQARAALRAERNSAEAYRILGMALRRAGRAREAKRAEESAISLAILNPTVSQAATALTAYDLGAAERFLRAHLRDQPDDAFALRMLAEVAAWMGHFDAAERLIFRALMTAPEYEAAKALLAAVHRVRARESLRANSKLPVSDDGEEPLDGDEIYRSGLKLYEQATQELPHSYESWVSYGYTLRVVGRQEEALDKFRRAVEINPVAGEAWWAIADLKSACFTEQDILRLRRLITESNVEPAARAQHCFALARALEQFHDAEGAFAAYKEGNSVRAKTSRYDPDAVERHVESSIRLFDEHFFREGRDAGEAAGDPIFIVGMPRSGSTLLEQILSTHPLIEGLSELSEISGLAKELAGLREAGFEDSPYLARLATLPHSEINNLGRRYIWGSGLRRRSMKPFFVDKMPNNWLHIGLIATILPNSKIIDARRNALDCCVSNYRQYYPMGQEFSYDLQQLGRYYADYVRMMDHFEKVLPGRILRVNHEQLIDNFEPEIRRVFQYLGIEFEERCLQFHKNKRAVGTASAEQVRRPLNRDGMAQWRAYERWLGPLKEALAPVMGA